MIVIMTLQGGSIKPLLRFGGRFLKRFEKNSKRIAIYVILTVYGENSITNSDCIAKIPIFAQTICNNPLCPRADK